MPIRSRAQRIGDKAEQVCESIVLNAANWIPRRQDRDFGIDLEAELTVLENGTETVTGKIVKIQVKGAAKPKEKDNAYWVRLSKDYLRYASEFRVPVLLVLVDIKTEEALYVWLQEYLLKRPVVDDQFKSMLVKIPRDSLLHVGLEGRVPEIARGDTDTSRHLALRELVETFSQSSDYHVFRRLLSILRAFEPDQDIWLFEKTLDQLIELGPHAGAWQTQEHSHVLMEVCRAFGDKLTKEQIVKMTQRGEAYSRAGLYGLTVLYDDWPDTVARYQLGDYFDQQEVFDVAWYCRFREFHRGKSSTDLWGATHSGLQTKFSTGFGELEITDDKLDYVYSKWPNRGDSAYLDCLSKALCKTT